MTAALSAFQGFLAAIGRTVLGLLQATGALAIFAALSVSHIFRPPWYPLEFGRQMLRIGYFSLPVVGLTTLFTGGALALQIYLGGSRFNAESAVPSIVAIGMVRELGPVLCGLMVAGRVSASIAAELGTMRVTEQIDALTTLSTNPLKYLVAPRLLAATLALPLLAFIGDIIGIAGGFLVGVGRLEFSPNAYIANTQQYLALEDVTSGLIKAAVFGFIIALMGCYQGYNSGRGAQGVGRATTNAVVSASIMILAANYILTEALFPRMTPMISMQGVEKAFGRKKVLRGIDLSVAKGESLVIIGGSGTGKSVTLKCVLGIVEPDAGRIEIAGEPATRRNRDALLKRFGMLFQGGALFDSMLVWENVAFRLRHGRDRRSRAEARDLAIERLRRVGLTPETADLYPAELSGGMQKRVGLARAIAADPEIIFFDEPTTGLDPIMAGVINELIRELVTEIGATAMTITHDMSSVRAIADRVAMLHDGVIRWEGPVSELDATDDPYVSQFVHGRAEGPIAAIR